MIGNTVAAEDQLRRACDGKAGDDCAICPMRNRNLARN